MILAKSFSNRKISQCGFTHVAVGYGRSIAESKPILRRYKFNVQSLGVATLRMLLEEFPTRVQFYGNSSTHRPLSFRNCQVSQFLDKNAPKIRLFSVECHQRKCLLFRLEPHPNKEFRARTHRWRIESAPMGVILNTRGRSRTPAVIARHASGHNIHLDTSFTFVTGLCFAQVFVYMFKRFRALTGAIFRHHNVWNVAIVCERSSVAMTLPYMVACIVIIHACVIK